MLKAMVSIGKYLAKQGCLLRSGGAKGADSAFERGCDLVGGQKEIYLPWKGFNKHPSQLFNVTKDARMLAKKYHPAWENLGWRGRDFMGRNAYQLLGQSLLVPSQFIVCWTQGGRITGGTGQALRMAADFQIPVFNLGSMTLDEIDDKLPAFLEKYNGPRYDLVS